MKSSASLTLANLIMEMRTMTVIQYVQFTIYRSCRLFADTGIRSRL